MATKTKNDPEAKVLWVPSIIKVANLKEGNRIVTKTAHIRLRELDEDKLEDVLAYFYTFREEPIQVVKSIKVQTIDIPEGKHHARTHIHVNKNACYDKRMNVWIAVPL